MDDEKEEGETSLVSDAYDYKGAPADKTKTGGWVSAATILGIEISERLTTMGIAVNLVTYLDNTMNQPSATSSTIVSNFSGFSFLFCLLGGFIADSFLGRYWTIAIFAVIEALGAGVLAISATVTGLRPPRCEPSQAAINSCVEANTMQMGVFYIALFALATGIAGVKSSVSALGTDQFDQTDKKEKTQMDYFFNRFYFVINIGTIIAVTFLVYVQDHVSRGVGYAICAAAMLAAVAVYLSRTRKYRYKKRMGSPLIQVIQVIVAAIKKRNLEFPSDVSLLYEDSLTESPRISRTNQFRWLDKAAIRGEGDFGEDGSATTPNPWKLSTVTKVEELKMMIRILPIWAASIMFWCVHAQMITFSVQQAASMDRSIGKFQVPPASFNVFFIGAVMITLALYDRLIMKRSQGLTNLQKIGVGLAISVVAMAAAAGMEQKRLKVIRENPTPSSTTTLPLTAFVLVPQFAIVGIAEAFMYSGQLAFFISEAPKGMKAISNSLFLSDIALGYFVTSILVDLIKKITAGKDGTPWLASKTNDSRLDYFYGLISVLSSINFGLYLVCARWYKQSSVRDGDVKASPDEEKV